MNLSEIQKYHSLTEARIETSLLLLDPRNPRINVGDDTDYSEDDIAKDYVQNEIFHRINKNEHHIAELISGFKNTGFSSGISTFIVKEIPGTGKFLVLEGNRRTTAIKQLLLNSHTLDRNVLESIRRIKVQIFKYEENPHFSEEEIIDIILGKIHITGPLAWGAMEKAHYIHKTYLRELKKSLGDYYQGYYQDDYKALKRTADFFDLKNSEVIKNIKVYNIFSQLKESGYDPKNDRYSLLELSVSDKEISEQYFGLDEFFDFSEVGMERFNNLCLEGNPPVIKNPQNMKDFIAILKRGNKEDINAVEEGLITVEEVALGLRQNQNKKNFANKLKDIQKKFENLNLHEFTNSQEEKKIINEIIKMLKGKIIPLFNDGVTPPPPEKTDSLTNIQTAIGMSSEDLRKTIISTVKSCVNQTCTQDSLVTRVLKEMDIHSRGEPRKNFADRVDRELAILIEEKSIKVYKAKNVRLRAS